MWSLRQSRIRVQSFFGPVDNLAARFEPVDIPAGQFLSVVAFAFLSLQALESAMAFLRSRDPVAQILDPHHEIRRVVLITLAVASIGILAVAGIIFFAPLD